MLAALAALPLLTIGVANPASAETFELKCGAKVAYGMVAVQACGEWKPSNTELHGVYFSVRVWNYADTPRTTTTSSWYAIEDDYGVVETDNLRTATRTVPARTSAGPSTVRYSVGSTNAYWWEDVTHYAAVTYGTHGTWSGYSMVVT